VFGTSARDKMQLAEMSVSGSISDIEAAQDKSKKELGTLYLIQFVSCPSFLALCISHPLQIPRSPQCHRARVNVCECRGGKRSKVSPWGALNLPAARRFLQTERFDPLPFPPRFIDNGTR